MSKPVTIAELTVWGRTAGALAWDEAANLGSFQYDKDFLDSGIDLAPITMPLGRKVYQFPELNRNSFYGLPGLLADSLPDKFGNLLINQWLAREGRKPASFNPVERLCYIGKRAMGALEFRPALTRLGEKSAPIEVAELVQLANDALAEKSSLQTHANLTDPDANVEKADAMRDILRVGTSAGGARAKAVIAWNPDTNEIRSGQIAAEETGFEYWLLKFDGVSENRDKETLADPLGYGAIEYAYHLMAREAGIEMTDCRLLEENGRRHFMTQRFDRLPDGKKLHMQTLCAMGHYDFNMAGAYSYEQAFQIMRELGFPTAAFAEMYRRMIFNVVTRNQDDHTKNIAFLMDKSGTWSLAPAYDVTYAYNPDGDWTSQHQMTLNGKRTDFELADFKAVATRFNLSKATERAIRDQVREAVNRWLHLAFRADIDSEWAEMIAKNHRIKTLDE